MKILHCPCYFLATLALSHTSCIIINQISKGKNEEKLAQVFLLYTRLKINKQLISDKIHRYKNLTISFHSPPDEIRLTSLANSKTLIFLKVPVRRPSRLGSFPETHSLFPKNLQFALIFLGTVV